MSKKKKKHVDKNKKEKEIILKKSRRTINYKNRYPNSSMENDKYEYGLSDW